MDENGGSSSGEEKKDTALKILQTA